ncbi:SIT4 phosphatase-associated protein family, Armadillo-type fold protein [Artemisia annua]|uniref:SIT4 phosphatase-associated protein family, Armadillo-type fold protein n=1 Tax=Artemisia annua TaxID=35608 RepID=A0A2U1MZE0_ARTAN|nr:SIT4 phosphatase-associated protein family, Armadillo-type fold protein [Artemisia annua]
MVSQAVVLEVQEEGAYYDPITRYGEYAKNGGKTVDVEATFDDAFNGDRVDETEVVADMANFTEVDDDRENETKEDSESRIDPLALSIEVSEQDLDVIDYELFGSDLDDGVDPQRKEHLKKLRRLGKAKHIGPFQFIFYLGQQFADRETVNPCNGRDMWPSVQSPTMLIPPFHKTQVGSQLKKRKMPVDELASQSSLTGKLCRKGKSIRCRFCGNLGHNMKGYMGQGDPKVVGSNQAASDMNGSNQAVGARNGSNQVAGARNGSNQASQRPNSCFDRKKNSLIEHVHEVGLLVRKVIDSEKNVALIVDPKILTLPVEGRTPPSIGNIGHMTRIANKLIEQGENSKLHTVIFACIPMCSIEDVRHYQPRAYNLDGLKYNKAPYFQSFEYLRHKIWRNLVTVGTV